MTWLDEPRDAVEARLREALDAATQRTGDEIAHRRLWTRIATPLPASRGNAWLPRLVLGGVLAAAVAGGFLVWPRHHVPAGPVAQSVDGQARPTAVPSAIVRQPLLDGPTTIRSDARNRTYLRLWGGTEVDLEPSSAFSLDRRNQPAVDKGRVSVSVPRQKPGHHFALQAGPYTITVIGTKFHVRVAGDSVGVDVDEGVVEVSRGNRVVKVQAGEFWNSPPAPEPHSRAHVTRVPEHVAMLASTPASTPATATTPVGIVGTAAEPSAVASDQFRQAQAALAERHPQRALEILEGLARGQGPSAENAAYEVGRILRYHLMHPRQALAAWYRYRARFPQGMLRAETDMSIIDALLVVGDKSGALGEAESFLARHPDSERRGDIARIVNQLRGEPREALSRREPTVPGAM
jgi:hypothetical protein